MATTFDDRLARIDAEKFADSPIQSGRRTRPVRERKATGAPQPWIMYYIKGLLFSAAVALVVLVIDAFKGNGALRQDLFADGWWPLGALGILILALPVSLNLRKQAAERAVSNVPAAERKAQDRRTANQLALRFAFPWFYLIPWWLFMALGILFAALAVDGYQDERAEEALGRHLASRAAPASVDLSAFDPVSDTHPLDELHVRGWVDAEHSQRLIKMRDNGKVRKSRFMHVLFGAADGPDATEVRAVILLRERERGPFAELLDAHAVGIRPQGTIHEINGFVGDTQALGPQMDKAFARAGLVKADNFVIIEPFLEGRQHALLNAADPLGFLIFASVLSLVFFAIAMLKLIAWRRRRATRLRARAA